MTTCLRTVPCTVLRFIFIYSTAVSSVDLERIRIAVNCAILNLMTKNRGRLSLGEKNEII